MKLIDAEKLIELVKEWRSKQMGFAWDAVNEVLKIIGSLQQEQPEVDLMDTRIQYESVQSGIKAFAETYSFNIDSRLFPQLSKEQQELWREEIEQAAVSGGDMGITLARDTRYKENQLQPEVDLEKEIAEHAENMPHSEFTHESECVEHEEWAKIEFRHFYSLGLNARNV